MQDKSSETVDFLAMRQERGWTIAHVSKLSGYGASTISALETKGEGGKHLKAKLISIYSESAGSNSEAAAGVALPEVGEPSPEEWKRRALAAETKLRHLQQACDALGQHVEGLASTVRHFSAIITE